MKLTFLTFLMVILTFESNAQQTRTETVYFEYDKYNLTSEAATILEILYNSIKTEKFNSINIIGYTDADGSDDYNLTLSKNRTKTVFDYFQAKGISKDKIQIQFYGENKPIAKNNSERDKQLNRRVEIIIEKGKTIDNDKFEKQAQFFSILSNKDTTLICNEGTIIKIKANSFVSEKAEQPITELIDFSVTEYYKISDIILSNLSTTSHGQLIETGGMLNINATANNQPLKLIKGKNIEISFPTNKKENDMQLFSGTWESTNQINWTEQSSDIENAQLVYTIVEEMPKYNGGEKKLLEYITQTVKYPKQARESGVQGTVYVSFVINETGEVKDPRITRGVSSELDFAAINAIKKMPNWTPGMQNGKNVSVQITVPVEFYLDDSRKRVSTYKERFEQSYSDSTMQKAGSESIFYYVFTSTNLSWINCDRFLKINPKINYVVKLDQEIETVKIIFDRYKAIMTSNPVNGNYSFKGVPLGEKITVVAIKRIDNIPYLSFKETKTSSKVEQELTFQPVTLESLRTEMKKLDKFD